MGVSHTWSIVLLQFFCHFRADALPFSITFQHKPWLFAYLSGTLKKVLPLFLKKERNSGKSISHLLLRLSFVFGFDQ